MTIDVVWMTATTFTTGTTSITILEDEMKRAAKQDHRPHNHTAQQPEQNVGSSYLGWLLSAVS